MKPPKKEFIIEKEKQDEGQKDRFYEEAVNKVKHKISRKEKKNKQEAFEPPIYFCHIEVDPSVTTCKYCFLKNSFN